jgi:hypothetical protein
MVTCEWHGRTGNNIFQYVFARVLAYKNGLKMGTEWPHQGFIRTSLHTPGETCHDPIEKINDLYYDQHDKDWYNNNYNGKRVYCSGFFQHPKYYDGYADLIRSFFIIDPHDKRPSSDIVMHIRLGDYADPGLMSVIQPAWYGKILQRLKFHPKTHRLYIVCENRDDPYLKKFLHYKPEIVSQSASQDFHFIRSFDTILCSNSSYCWWAAWLSTASRIFTFSHWIREPHRYKLRLAFMRRATPVIGTWIP